MVKFRWKFSLERMKVIMEIVICVGNCCYSKGACEIAGEFQKLIHAYDLSDVTVSASFCMKHGSSEGVSVEIDGNLVDGVTPENAKDVFAKYVLHPVARVSR